MAKVSPGEYIRQVKLEGLKKVTWPSRKETAISTATVLVMIVLVALFFLLIDQFFAWAVKAVLGLGR